MTFVVLTELGRSRSIDSHTCPIVGPSLVLVRTTADHRLDSEANTWFRLTDGLVLSVVRDIWSAVEKCVDTVANVGLDGTAVPAFGVLLDNVAEFLVGRARLDLRDSFL